MATLTLTPKTQRIEKDAAGNYVVVYRMVDGASTVRGECRLHIDASTGAVTDERGMATGYTLSAGNLTALGNVFTGLATIGTNADTGGHLFF